MARLILHIGQTKTATTTIQAFLHGNQERLGDYGLHYLARPRQARSHRCIYHALHIETFPETGRLVQQKMLHLTKLGLVAPSQGPSEVCEQVWQLLGTSLQEAQGLTALLSEELLWHLGGFRRQLRLPLLRTLRRRLLELVEPHELMVIACLRHHADWAESWHNQMVKDTGNQLPISHFIRNQAEGGAFRYAQNLIDWLTIFPEAELKLLDFHGQLINSKQPPGLTLLTICGLLEAEKLKQSTGWNYPQRLQESIHPFVHHWITRHKPQQLGLQRYKRAVQRASEQVSRFAERRFGDQRFTVLRPELVQTLNNWAIADPLDELFGQSMTLSSKLLERVRIPQPLPQRAREICTVAFNLHPNSEDWRGRRA